MAQDSFDLDSDKAALVVTIVRTASPATSCGSCRGCANSRASLGKILGGWQVSSFFTFQSGAPFTVLNGSDPDRRHRGHRRSGRQRDPSDAQHRSRAVEDDHRRDSRGGRRVSLFRVLCGMRDTLPVPVSASATSAATRCAPTASATWTSGSPKNTRFANGQNIQFRVEMFNATNTRNFGIPDGRINSAQLPQSVGAPTAATAESGSQLRYVF